jgi:hypothetical protein
MAMVLAQQPRMATLAPASAEAELEPAEAAGQVGTVAGLDPGVLRAADERTGWIMLQILVLLFLFIALIVPLGIVAASFYLF